MKGRRNRRKERVMARHEETERNEGKERRKDGVNDKMSPETDPPVSTSLCRVLPHSTVPTVRSSCRSFFSSLLHSLPFGRLVAEVKRMSGERRET